MKPPKIFLLLLVVLLPFYAAAQPVDDVEEEAAQNRVEFYLIPLLEAAFSGSLAWRPDWPADFPPDAFSLPIEKNRPLGIALSDSRENLNFTRDSAGRLGEFPFFLPDGYLKVKAEYAASGALRSLGVTAVAANAVPDETAAFADPDAGGQAIPETVWNIEFPADFFPYSGISPGIFQPVRIDRDGTAFFVFIFEAAAFLTETWYDEDGNLLGFCKALVSRENGSPSNSRPWRLRSLEKRDTAGFRTEDYFYDSYGNISEIRCQEGVFSALYRDGRPHYWQYQPDVGYDLQWDTRGFLTEIKGGPIEYRYEYELDASGNWVKRWEIPVINQFGVYAPQPSGGRRVWSRQISLPEN